MKHEAPSSATEEVERQSLHEGIAFSKNRGWKCGGKEGASIRLYAEAKLYDSIDKWVRAGRRNRSRTALFLRMAEIRTQIGLRRLANVIAVVTMESLDKPGMTFQRLALALGVAVENEWLRYRLRPEQRRAMRVIVKRNERRRFLRAHITSDALESRDAKARIRLGRLVAMLCQRSTGLFSIDGGRIVPSPKMLSFVEERSLERGKARPFYMPIPDPPRPWVGVHEGGHYDETLAERPLIRARSLKAAKKLEQAQYPALFEAVNAIQATPWRIHAKTHEAFEELWFSGSRDFGLPLREDREYPEYVPNLDTLGRKKMAARRAAICEENRDSWRGRSRVQKTAWIAKRMGGFERFYYPLHLDFRGRVYPLCFWLSVAGNDLSRGLLSFADARVVPRGSKAEEWLWIHGANLFGLSRKSIPERLQWVRENRDRVLRLARSPGEEMEFWRQAKEPWQFHQWAVEYEAVERGEPTGCVVMMDSTANGCQMIALLTGDRELAGMTNLLPSSAPRDLYAEIAAETASLVARTRYGSRWISYGGESLSRDAVKPVVMATPFGLTEQGALIMLREWYLSLPAVKEQGGGFGQRYEIDAISTLYRSLVEAMGRKIPQVMRFTRWMFAVSSKLLGSSKDEIAWTTPVGLDVYQSYPARKEIDSMLGRYVAANLSGDPSFSKSHHRLALPANFIHSLDASALLLAVGAAHRAGIRSFATVHDCYGLHPNDVEVFRAILPSVYVQMFSGEPLLERFHRECEERSGVSLPSPPYIGTLDLYQVNASTYFAT